MKRFKRLENVFDKLVLISAVLFVVLGFLNDGILGVWTDSPDGLHFLLGFIIGLLVLVWIVARHFTRSREGAWLALGISLILGITCGATLSFLWKVVPHALHAFQ